MRARLNNGEVWVRSLPVTGSVGQVTARRPRSRTRTQPVCLSLTDMDKRRVRPRDDECDLREVMHEARDLELQALMAQWICRQNCRCSQWTMSPDDAPESTGGCPAGPGRRRRPRAAPPGFFLPPSCFETLLFFFLWWPTCPKSATGKQRPHTAWYCQI